MRDGAQASLGKEMDLVVRLIQKSIKDFRCELQQVARLGDSCSGHAQMLGQVSLSGIRIIFEKVFEDERLFHRINNRDARFVLDRSWFAIRGFNGRYEKLALMQSRKVNPERQIEKVRKSFGRGEAVFSRYLWPRF